MNEEHHILETLRMEWRLASWCLPSKLQQLFHLPGFELRDMETRWGAWLGDRKIIIINSRLIKTTSWPCMREVLRHEMAHQLTDEVFHVKDTSHGDRFKDACRLLNADPRASGSLPSIHQWIQQHEATDPRIEKIRKLLALAASPNPHEAEQAMLKAHEWMTRYNIDPTRPKGSEYVSMCLGSPSLRHSVVNDALASILRDFYFVETVYVSITVPSVLKKGSILEISGTKENVRMASYVFDFLRQSIAAQIEQREIYRKRSQNDYAVGFLKSVGEKLTEQRKVMFDANPGTTALIKAGDAELHAYFRERYPRLRTRYTGGRNMDQNAYNAGIKDGRNLIIHKPIESSSGHSRHMLTS